MRSSPKLVAAAILWSLASGRVDADSMNVPSVELRESESGHYVLEARLAPALVAGAGSPMAPERCLVLDPERVVEAGAMRVSYAIYCGAEPLEPGDVLILPWFVDGIELTAVWLDGSRRRALFGRDSVGVVIRLHLILDRKENFIDRVEEYGGAAWDHFRRGPNHWLLIVALVLAGAGSFRIVWPGLAGVAVGHGVSVVAAELGLIGLPLIPAEAVLAGAAMLLMASVVREESLPRGLVFAGVVLGTLHGLGMASDLAGSGTAASELVPALFIFNGALDLGALLLAVGTAVLWRAFGAGLKPWRVSVAAFIGTAAMFLLFAIMHDGLATSSAIARETGFMEVEALAGAASVSAASLASPPTQTDARGRLASPFMSYLIVEPYQIRHEVLVEVKSTQDWIDIDVDASAHIPVYAQKALSESIATLIAERNSVSIDGAVARAVSERADFILLGPTGALTRETAVPEALDTAMVGVTLVYETESIAEEVGLDWGLFSDVVSAVPMMMTDPVAMAETELTLEEPRFEWRNTLGELELPEIEAIAAERPRTPLVSLGFGVLALAAWGVARKPRIAVLCMVTAYVLYPFARMRVAIPLVSEIRIDREEAGRVIEGLLTNVYRCFDIHNEDLIYDRLALTVTGEQLLDVYLESRRALELENRGGARVRIDEVVVREIRTIRETDDGGYRLDTLWSVGGSVNHFGHIHFRQNEYDATITIVPVEDTWKIQSLELIEERRVL